MWKHALGTNIYNPAHFLVTDETNISLLAPYTGPQGTNIYDPTQFVLTDGTNVHLKSAARGTNLNFYGATTNFGTLYGFTWSESDVIGLVADLALKENAANKGIAGGYASLDGTTKVPIAQIPTGITGTTVPFGDDVRFSDARTPLAHTHPESDVVNLVSDLATKEAVANKGTANGYASLDSGTKVPIAQLPTGTSSSTVTIGNDARLSDSRTPLAHANTHTNGGTDFIRLDTLAAPTDSTALNASTSIHGLLKKLSGSASDFMNGAGNWAVPPDIGEANTASNVGTVGTGIFKQKSLIDLQFYKINSIDNKLAIALNGTDRIDFTINSDNVVSASTDSRLSDSRTPTVHNVLDSTKHGDVLTGSIARGDLLYGNATPKIAKLAIGSTGKFVRSDGTDPSWQAIAEADVTSLAADLTARELTANKAAASGYASLDSGTKVPIAQIPTIPWTLLSGVVTNAFNTNQISISGTTNVNIKDGVLLTNLASYTADGNPVKFNAASQKIRLYGYVDAARGSEIDAIDPTETNYYGKLTLNGSSLIFQAGGITRSSIDSVETLFYNTYTNPTNYEAFSYQWSGNQFYMSTAAGSSGGTERHLNIRAGLTGQLKLGANDVDAIVTINTNSFVGINTLGPDRRLDILDAGNPQIRLTYSDSSAYTDLKTDVSGNLTVTPSGLSTFNTGTFYTSVKMGIGMATTPSSLLEVNGVNSSGIATITLTGTTASGGSNTVDFKRSGGTVNAQVTSIASGANDAAIIQVLTRNLAGTIAPRTTVDTEGNYGIGITPTSLLHVNGAIATPILTKTTNYTLTISDDFILADAASSNLIITLPAVVSGREYTVKRKNSGANTVTVATTSSQNIDGATTFVLTVKYQGITVKADSLAYYIK